MSDTNVSLSMCLVYRNKLLNTDVYRNLLNACAQKHTIFEYSSVNCIKDYWLILLQRVI